MNPVRGIETPPQTSLLTRFGTFKLMNPVRGIETCIHRHEDKEGCQPFKLMNPVRGIETAESKYFWRAALPFKLMNPVRGIETLSFPRVSMQRHCFQINESRSRD